MSAELNGTVLWLFNKRDKNNERLQTAEQKNCNGILLPSLHRENCFLNFDSINKKRRVQGSIPNAHKQHTKVRTEFCVLSPTEKGRGKNI